MKVNSGDEKFGDFSIANIPKCQFAETYPLAPFRQSNRVTVEALPGGSRQRQPLTLVALSHHYTTGLCNGCSHESRCPIELMFCYRWLSPCYRDE